MPTQNAKPRASPQPEPPEKVAEAPFDDDTEADLILLSSDEVRFYVVKKILTLASPIFADTFSTLPPPHQKSHDVLPVVPLPEPSTTLDLALRHIYPVRSPKTDTLHNASVLAEFARNYKVEALDISGDLTDSVERDPVGVYAIAVTHGYKDIGTKAARLCLNLPFSKLQSPYLQCATAEHISDLFRYHVACGEVASALASSFDRIWLSPLLSKGIFRIKGAGGRAVACPSCIAPDLINQVPINQVPINQVPISEYFYDDDSDEESSKRRTGPLCLWGYLYRSALVLAHHPTPEAITERKFVLKDNDCRSCAQGMEGHLLYLSVVLGEEIKKAIERVPLPKVVSLGPSSDDATSN